MHIVIIKYVIYGFLDENTFSILVASSSLCLFISFVIFANNSKPSSSYFILFSKSGKISFNNLFSFISSSVLASIIKLWLSLFSLSTLSPKSRNIDSVFTLNDRVLAFIFLTILFVLNISKANCSSL